MGVTFYQRVTFKCKESEREYFDTLPQRVPASHYMGDTPIYGKEISDDGRVISFDSGGYGTFDFGSMDRPSSLEMILYFVKSCQSDDINFVESISVEDIESFESLMHWAAEFNIYDIKEQCELDFNKAERYKEKYKVVEAELERIDENTPNLTLEEYNKIENDLCDKIYEEIDKEMIKEIDEVYKEMGGR